MNIHIDRQGERTVKLTRSEVQTLNRARLIVSDLCRFDPTIITLLDESGATGLGDMLETLPCCQLPKPKETKPDVPA